jgi:ribokinase
MDLVSVVERAPRPGETVFGSDFQMYSGGKGANQAVAAARLGSRSILLGKVGTDIFGTQLLDILVNEGVDISHIERVSSSTGTATIVVDARGENSIIVTPSANTHVSPEYVESKIEVLRGAGMVLAQLEIPLETIRRLAELCEQLQVALMLDPAPAQSLDPATLARVSWLTPNQTEADFYVNGAEGSKDIVQSLLRQKVQNVILKRGNAGVLIGTSGDRARYTVDAFPVSAVDTTAAGDSFNGAFAVAQVRGLSVQESARYAAAAAALSVTRKGAQSSLPTSKEVDLFLASFEAATHA